MPILKVQTDARLVRQGLESLRREMPRIGRARMYYALQRAVHRLKQPGKKPTYPIRWDSIRQRKAFFATDGFGGGIPHRRTGAYQKGYRIRALPQGHEVINTVPGAQFVGGTARGTRQSRIHQGRWPLLRNEVDKELSKLPNAVIDHLKVVARQKGLNVQ